MTPRFSICIPVRNEAHFMGRAIQSALDQTDADFELIIGDNASDDGLDAVVASFDDPRLIHHRFDELVPVNESWNRTIDLCRCEWIVPMSADDVMRPNCLASLRAAIDANADHAPALLSGAVLRVDPDGRRDDIGTGEQPVGAEIAYRPIAPGLHDARSWLMSNAAPGLSPWMIGSVAFRRDLISASGFYRPDMELCADWELVMRMAAYGPVVWVDEILLDYTVRSGSATSGFVLRDLERNQPTTMNERSWMAILQLHRERRTLEPDELAVIHASIARQLLQRALWHRTNPAGKGRLSALRDIWRAGRYSPASLKSPVQMGVLVGALIAPRWVLDKGREIGHRRGVILV